MAGTDNVSQSRYRRAASILGSEMASSLYLSTGIDTTYPVQVIAKLTNACNSRCEMCGKWRRMENVEIPARHWVKALQGLKSRIRPVMANFVGGEVLLKEDVFEIFRACADAGIPFGMTTNGILLTEGNCESYLECRPMNLTVSLDSLNPDTYEYIRGVSRLELVLENIEALMARLASTGSSLRVRLNTVVNAKNRCRGNHLRPHQTISRALHHVEVRGNVRDGA